MSSLASAIVVGVFILTALLARVVWECYIRVRTQKQLPISKEPPAVTPKKFDEALQPWGETPSGRPVCSRGTSARGRSLEHLVPCEEDLEFPLRPSSRNGERPPSRGSDAGRPGSPERPISRDSSRSATSYTQAQMRGGRGRSPGAPLRSAVSQPHAWSQATAGLPREPGISLAEERAWSRPGSPDSPESRERSEIHRPDTSWTLPGSEFMLFAWKTWTPGTVEWTISSENLPPGIPIGSRTAWEMPESPSKPVRREQHSASTAGNPVQRPCTGTPTARAQAAQGLHRPAGSAAQPGTAASANAPRSSTPAGATPGTPSRRHFWRAWTAGASVGGQRPPSKSSTWSWLQNKRPQTATLSTSSDSLIATMNQQLQETRGNPLEDRKRIFRDLQRQLHPDKNVDHEEAAKLAFQELMQQRASYLAP